MPTKSQVSLLVAGALCVCVALFRTPQQNFITRDVLPKLKSDIIASYQQRQQTTWQQPRGVKLVDFAAPSGNFCPFKPPANATNSGGWNYTAAMIKQNHCKFDPGFGGELVSFLGRATLVDVGAGVGQLGHFLQKHPSNITWFGFDGGYNIESLRGRHLAVRDDRTHVVPKVCWMDASVPLPDTEQTFDWTLSVEVGEHIARQHEAVFMDNLARLCRTGVILTWAVEGQGGFHHVNCRNNDYIIAQMERRGFKYDEPQSMHFRKSVTDLGWLRGTIMVFWKRN